jgi:cell division protein FtsZ
MVQELAGEAANIIFGAMFDDTTPDEATITVIATGLDAKGSAVEQKGPSFLKQSIARPDYRFGSNNTMNSSSSFAKSQAQTAATSNTYNPKPLNQGYTSPMNTGNNPSFNPGDTSGIKIPEFLQKNRNHK